MVRRVAQIIFGLSADSIDSVPRMPLAHGPRYDPSHTSRITTDDKE